MVRKAAELLARVGRRDEAAKMLADMLAAAPARVGAPYQGGASAGEHPVLARLYEHAGGRQAFRRSHARGHSVAGADESDRPGPGRGAACARARAGQHRTAHRAGQSAAVDQRPRRARIANSKRRARSPRPTTASSATSAWWSSAWANTTTAEAYLRGAVEANPKDLRSRLDLARCLLNQKRFAEAAQSLRDAITTFPDRAEVYAMLGHVLRWRGEHPEALVHLARAVELAPDNSLAMVEIAQIREEIGEFEPALDLHRRAAEARKDPSYNATIYCHALLAAGRGREAWATNMNRVECAAAAHAAGRSRVGWRAACGQIRSSSSTKAVPATRFAMPAPIPM